MAVTMVQVDTVSSCAPRPSASPMIRPCCCSRGATSSMDSWDPDVLRSPGRCGPVRRPLRPPRHRPVDDVAGGAPGYTGDDLSLDPLRLLDALGIDAAHLVGVSMGGGIAQDLAVRFPDRVLSLTLVATSAAFERSDPTPLPPLQPQVLAVFRAGRRCRRLERHRRGRRGAGAGGAPSSPGAGFDETRVRARRSGARSVARTTCMPAWSTTGRSSAPETTTGRHAG